MQYLLGLIGLLVGGLLFYKNKAGSAEAINNNVETKEAVVKEDGSIAKNQGEIEAEKNAVQKSKDEESKEENKNETNQDLVDFLNKFSNRNK